MLDADKEDFLRVLNGMAAVRRIELTKEAIAIWWATMAAWSFAGFAAGASHLIRHCQYMPTPYDFEQLRRVSDQTASEAWLDALKACRNWGDPLPQGRLARAVAVVGGLRAIAMADQERDLPHIARRFREAFQELTDVETSREALIDSRAAGLIGVTHNPR